ncbi:MAG: hypothetical protein AAF711_05010 [Planctomycetota bacterium]
MARFAYHFAGHASGLNNIGFVFGVQVRQYADRVVGVRDAGLGVHRERQLRVAMPGQLHGNADRHAGQGKPGDKRLT